MIIILSLSLSLLQEETVNHDRSLINIIPPVPGHQHTSCTLETLRNNVLRVLRCALLHIKAILEYGTVIFPPWPYLPPPPLHTRVDSFPFAEKRFFFFFFFLLEKYFRHFLLSYETCWPQDTRKVDAYIHGNEI